MQEIGALEAERSFGDLLDRVENGEEVLIIRDGKAVARLVPSSAAADPEASRRAAEAILAMSVGTTLRGADLRDLIAEGRL